MNEEQLEDLKRFIANTVSQSVTASEERMMRRLDTLEKKVDDGFAGVADTFEVLTEQIDERFDKVDGRLDDHEHSIVTLEQAA
jgi:tetrahydromethanopterin S-methyltransferase subunit G